MSRTRHGSSQTMDVEFVFLPSLRDGRAGMTQVEVRLSRWMATAAALVIALTATAGQGVTDVPPLVFVSRAIPSEGTVYLAAGRSLPGVGPFARFTVASPGRLLVREPDGRIRVLVDGAEPASNAFRLVDVNAPDVSFDGQRIVFAGAPDAEYRDDDRGRLANPGTWRLYVINVDGTGLRQLTHSDRAVDLSRLGPRAAADFERYDDTDPAWLPDGRVVFSSTRWPAYGQYSAAHTTQLFVVREDGTGMRRITGERSGADRPLVDPLTGRIVYSRWWRNHRLAAQAFDTIPSPDGFGYRRHLGLAAAVDAELSGVGPIENIVRNSWHLVTIRPDGGDLKLFAGVSGLFDDGEDDNHAYGGSFAADGSVFTSFFPMRNLTEAAGFGGVRHYARGPGRPAPVMGVTSNAIGQPFVSESPRSYAVYRSPVYAAEPEALPDGRIVLSRASSVAQDYGLYLAGADGSAATLLYDVPGRSELRARVVAPRPVPPIVPDASARVPGGLPPEAGGPYDVDGTFVFDALNVYFNAPVDVPIINAPAVGSAETIRFYLDHQRTAVGSADREDWPILLGTATVRPDGSIPPTALPAHLPLFEQVRDRAGRVPMTGRGSRRAASGATHVAGLNYGVAGERVRCVGCHAGHSLIAVPPTDEEARWTNLAPGASITQSSLDPSLDGVADGLVDRRVHTGRPEWFWRSEPGQSPNGQWVALTFPQPVRVRTVRLHGAPPSASVSTEVQQLRVSVFATPSSAQPVFSTIVGPVSDAGTEVAVGDLVAQHIRLEFLGVTGTTRAQYIATLAEVEVVARAEAGGR